MLVAALDCAKLNVVLCDCYISQALGLVAHMVPSVNKLFSFSRLSSRAHVVVCSPLIVVQEGNLEPEWTSPGTFGPYYTVDAMRHRSGLWEKAREAN